MSDGTWSGRRAWLKARTPLLAILLLATGLRLAAIGHDLPFSFYGDELYMMKRGMAMGTGDLNPHWYHKPALLMYLLLGVYGAFAAVGLASGRYGSVEEVGARFLADHGPFLLLGRLVIVAFSVALVWAAYRLALAGLRDRRAALVAALVTAVLPGLFSSSVVIKSDIPSAFFTTAAAAVLLSWRPERGWSRLAAGAVLAGVGMGAHYYALAFVPAFMLLAQLRARAAGWRGSRSLAAACLVPVLFTAAFFVTSPYNFLDSRAREFILGKAEEGLPSATGETQWEPDREIAYQPGPATWAGATADLLRVLASPAALGVPLAILALAGMIATARDRERRDHAWVVGGAFVVYAALAALADPYHVQVRHLCPLYPLLATLVWPGAMALVSPLRRRWPSPSLVFVAAAIALAATVPSLVVTLSEVQDLRRLDSRVVAHRWIVEHLPPGRMLLDHYGPELQPDVTSLARQQRLLRTLPRGPFTEPQAARMALLRRYPAANAFDLDELGHPWWLPHERPDSELRSDPYHLDMGNPLPSRVPRPLDEYRRLGYRWIVTNSLARSRYFHPRARRAEFPSFVRFYEELGALEPIRTFDPREWDGTGPVVWVYDLGPARDERLDPIGRRPGEPR